MKIILLFFLTTTIYCQNIFIRDLIAIDENNLIAVGDNGLIIKTTDGGKNWYDKSIQTDEDFMEVESFGTKLWLRTYSTNRILYSEDLGINWTEIYQFKDGYITEMFFLNDSIGFMIVPDWDIFKTLDGGKTWSKIPGSYYRAASIYFLDEHTGWIGGSNQIYTTIDGGNEWSTKSLGTYDSQIRAICFLDNSNGYIVSSGQSFPSGQIGIFASTTDNGTTWEKYGEAGFMTDVYFSSPDSGWIISNNRILFTKDHGVSWDSTNATAYDFEFIKNKSWCLSGGRILFSDDGWKIQSQQYPKVTSVEPEISYQYNLSQNYPNPFNPSTNINYSTKKAGKVFIEIYDILGRRIQTLVNQYQTEGNYSIIFNGDELPSGIYFCKMSVNNFDDVKKIILMK